jgi:hypothetical protein
MIIELLRDIYEARVGVKPENWRNVDYLCKGIYEAITGLVLPDDYSIPQILEAILTGIQASGVNVHFAVGDGQLVETWNDLLPAPPDFGIEGGQLWVDSDDTGFSIEDVALYYEGAN